jgi:hypothetical protein
MKYIIRWNTGCGDSAEVIEADSMSEAEEAAYEFWREDVESSADYEAYEYTQDLADDYGLVE